ncbi:MAG: sigma-70 family RNA polymerase sigma factor [Verrucomicrobia bacterium]|nr:sigma-70 family RNA polymerase sigma factor [Verrucomicrobiota bacterium]
MLKAIQEGRPQEAEGLLPAVYSELRKIAAARMAREAPGHTLQPTALVHEAWMRMFGNDEQRFQGRAHFFAAAAEAMRRILVESARRRWSLKRGGGAQHVELQESQIFQPMPSDELLAVDEALDLSAAKDPTAADLVKLKYFVGMNMEEAAAALGLSLRNAERIWAYARAWLRRKVMDVSG